MEGMETICHHPNNRMLSVSEVVSEILHFQPSFPKNAVNSARAQKDKIIPELLKILDHTADNIEEILEDSEYSGHIFSTFLLAEFRVEEALSKVIRLLKLPEDVINSLWSDLIEDYMPRIFASMSVSSTKPIVLCLEDKNISIRIKKQLLKALIIKYLNDEISRHELMSYFKEIMQKSLNDEYWQNKELLSYLVSIVDEIHPDELYEIIYKLYEQNLIIEDVITLNKINCSINDNKIDRINMAKSNQKNKIPCDLLSEMEQWPCYNYVDFKHAKRLSSEEKEEKQKFINEFMSFINPDTKFNNNIDSNNITNNYSSDQEYRSNDNQELDTKLEILEITKPKCLENADIKSLPKPDDPCPCGSGLKFKKCCYVYLSSNRNSNNNCNLH